MQPWTQFSATVDYWHIDLQDKIGNIPPSQAVTDCVTNGNFCDLIHRDPTPARCGAATTAT